MFDKNNLSLLMKQAKQMQDKMNKMQGEIAEIEVIGKSGAGLVQITMNGVYNCRNVKLSSEILSDDKEVLEDLIAAAFNDAVSKISEIQKEKMKSVNIPHQF